VPLAPDRAALVLNVTLTHLGFALVSLGTLGRHASTALGGQDGFDSTREAVGVAMGCQEVVVQHSQMCHHALAQVTISSLEPTEAEFGIEVQLGEGALGQGEEVRFRDILQLV
jgi:hypothetical protein